MKRRRAQPIGYIELLLGTKIDIFAIRTVGFGTELITAEGLFFLTEKIEEDAISIRTKRNALYQYSIRPISKYILSIFDDGVPETMSEEVGFKQVVIFVPLMQALKNKLKSFWR